MPTSAKVKRNSKAKVVISESINKQEEKEESRTSLTGHITVEGSTSEVLQDLLNPLEHILKRYNSHPVFSSVALILVIIVSIGQVTDSIDKTIKFTEEHFAFPSAVQEISLEQKSLFIEENIKLLETIHSNIFTQNQAIDKNINNKTNSNNIQSPQKIAKQNTKQKADSKKNISPKTSTQKGENIAANTDMHNVKQEEQFRKIREKLNSERNTASSNETNHFERLQNIQKVIRSEP